MWLLLLLILISTVSAPPTWMDHPPVAPGVGAPSSSGYDFDDGQRLGRAYWLEKLPAVSSGRALYTPIELTRSLPWQEPAARSRLYQLVQRLYAQYRDRLSAQFNHPYPPPPPLPVTPAPQHAWYPPQEVTSQAPPPAPEDSVPDEDHLDTQLGMKTPLIPDLPYHVITELPTDWQYGHDSSIDLPLDEFPPNPLQPPFTVSKNPVFPYYSISHASAPFSPSSAALALTNQQAMFVNNHGVPGDVIPPPLVESAAQSHYPVWVTNDPNVIPAQLIPNHLQAAVPLPSPISPYPAPITLSGLETASQNPTPLHSTVQSVSAHQDLNPASNQQQTATHDILNDSEPTIQSSTEGTTLSSIFPLHTVPILPTNGPLPVTELSTATSSEIVAVALNAVTPIPLSHSLPPAVQPTTDEIPAVNPSIMTDSAPVTNSSPSSTDDGIIDVNNLSSVNNVSVDDSIVVTVTPLTAEISQSPQNILLADTFGDAGGNVVTTEASVENIYGHATEHQFPVVVITHQPVQEATTSILVGTHKITHLLTASTSTISPMTPETGFATVSTSLPDHVQETPNNSNVQPPGTLTTNNETSNDDNYFNIILTPEFTDAISEVIESSEHSGSHDTLGSAHGNSGDPITSTTTEYVSKFSDSSTKGISTDLPNLTADETSEDIQYAVPNHSENHIYNTSTHQETSHLEEAFSDEYEDSLSVPIINLPDVSLQVVSGLVPVLTEEPIIAEATNMGVTGNLEITNISEISTAPISEETSEHLSLISEAVPQVLPDMEPASTVVPSLQSSGEVMTQSTIDVSEHTAVNITNSTETSLDHNQDILLQETQVHQVNNKAPPKDSANGTMTDYSDTYDYDGSSHVTTYDHTIMEATSRLPVTSVPTTEYQVEFDKYGSYDSNHNSQEHETHVPHHDSQNQGTNGHDHGSSYDPHYDHYENHAYDPHYDPYEYDAYDPHFDSYEHQAYDPHYGSHGHEAYDSYHDSHDHEVYDPHHDSHEHQAYYSHHGSQEHGAYEPPHNDQKPSGNLDHSEMAAVPTPETNVNSEINKPEHVVNVQDAYSGNLSTFIEQKNPTTNEQDEVTDKPSNHPYVTQTSNGNLTEASSQEHEVPVEIHTGLDGPTELSGLFVPDSTSNESGVSIESTTHTNEQTIASELEAETTTVVASLLNQSNSLLELGNITADRTSDLHNQMGGNNVVDDTELTEQSGVSIEGTTNPNEQTIASVLEAETTTVVASLLNQSNLLTELGNTAADSTSNVQNQMGGNTVVDQAELTEESGMINEGTTNTNEQTISSVLEAETTTVVASLLNQSNSLTELGNIAAGSTSVVQNQMGGNNNVDNTELTEELSSLPEDNIAGSTVENLIDQTINSVITIVSQVQELTTAGSTTPEEEGRFAGNQQNHELIAEASEYIVGTKPAIHVADKEHLTEESTHNSNSQYEKVTEQQNVDQQNHELIAEASEYVGTKPAIHVADKEHLTEESTHNSNSQYEKVTEQQNVDQQNQQNQELIAEASEYVVGTKPAIHVADKDHLTEESTHNSNSQYEKVTEQQNVDRDTTLNKTKPWPFYENHNHEKDVNDNKDFNEKDVYDHEDGDDIIKDKDDEDDEEDDVHRDVENIKEKDDNHRDDDDDNHDEDDHSNKADDEDDHDNKDEDDHDKDGYDDDHDEDKDKDDDDDPEDDDHDKDKDEEEDDKDSGDDNRDQDMDADEGDDHDKDKDDDQDDDHDKDKDDNEDDDHDKHDENDVHDKNDEEDDDHDSGDDDDDHDHDKRDSDHHDDDDDEEEEEEDDGHKKDKDGQDKDGDDHDKDGDDHDKDGDDHDKDGDDHDKDGDDHDKDGDDHDKDGDDHDKDGDDHDKDGDDHDKDGDDHDKDGDDHDKDGDDHDKNEDDYDMDKDDEDDDHSDHNGEDDLNYKPPASTTVGDLETLAPTTAEPLALSSEGSLHVFVDNTLEEDLEALGSIIEPLVETTEMVLEALGATTTEQNLVALATSTEPLADTTDEALDALTISSTEDIRVVAITNALPADTTEETSENLAATSTEDSIEVLITTEPLADTMEPTQEIFTVSDFEAGINMTESLTDTTEEALEALTVTPMRDDFEALTSTKEPLVDTAEGGLGALVVTSMEDGSEAAATTTTTTTTTSTPLGDSMEEPLEVFPATITENDIGVLATTTEPLAFTMEEALAPTTVSVANTMEEDLQNLFTMVEPVLDTTEVTLEALGATTTVRNMEAVAISTEPLANPTDETLTVIITQDDIGVVATTTEPLADTMEEDLEALALTTAGPFVLTSEDASQVIVANTMEQDQQDLFIEVEPVLSTTDTTVEALGAATTEQNLEAVTTNTELLANPTDEALPTLTLTITQEDIGVVATTTEPLADTTEDNLEALALTTAEPLVLTSDDASQVSMGMEQDQQDLFQVEPALDTTDVAVESLVATTTEQSLEAVITNTERLSDTTDEALEALAVISTEDDIRIVATTNVPLAEATEEILEALESTNVEDNIRVVTTTTEPLADALGALDVFMTTTAGEDSETITNTTESVAITTEPALAGLAVTAVDENVEAVAATTEPLDNTIQAALEAVASTSTEDGIRVVATTSEPVADTSEAPLQGLVATNIAEDLEGFATIIEPLVETTEAATEALGTTSLENDIRVVATTTEALSDTMVPAIEDVAATTEVAIDSVAETTTIAGAAAISDIETVPSMPRIKVELNSLHDNVPYSGVNSEDHTSDLETPVNLHSAADSDLSTTESLIPLDSNIESVHIEKPQILNLESETEIPYQVQNLPQNNPLAGGHEKPENSVVEQDDVTTVTPDFPHSHNEGPVGYTDESSVHKPAFIEGEEGVVQVMPALTLLLHRLLSENESTMISTSNHRLGKILRFARSKLEERAHDFKLSVDSDVSDRNGALPARQFGSETGTEGTPANETATEADGEFIELTAEDVLLLIPIIIDELKTGAMTEEEQQLFEGAFGDLWPIIVAEAEARRRKEEMTAAGATGRPRENVPAEPRRRRSASNRDLLSRQSGTTTGRVSDAAVGRGGQLRAEEALFIELSDNGAEGVDTRPRGRPSSQPRPRHGERQPRTASQLDR